MVTMFITIGILTVLGVLVIILWYNNFFYKSDNYVLSFKESMDLTDLPVITFYNGEEKLNFLLDTGSDKSYINKHILKRLSYEKSNFKTSAMGIDGTPKECNAIQMHIHYKDLDFNELFFVMDLKDSFDTIKKESGVTINGILGSVFFRKYGYMLDFEKLKVKIK